MYKLGLTTSTTE